MAQTMTISVADKVVDEISYLMKETDKSNKSEFVEELIRTGLLYHKAIDTHQKKHGNGNKKNEGEKYGDDEPRTQ